MNRLSIVLASLALSAGVVLVPATAAAETIVFVAALNPAAEVPPKASSGTGTVQATYNTKNNHLQYVVTYKDLTGTATAAHFHGPAMTGANAGIAVGLKGSLDSPISGEATLTAAQAADLMSGKWYFNVHTAANPAGEIRGQMEAQK